MQITIADTEISDADWPGYLAAIAQQEPWLLAPDDWEWEIDAASGGVTH